MSKAVLTYFHGRGRAEICRLTMAATGVEWECVDLTEIQQWEDLKKSGKLLFNQAPLIEFEGKNLVQTGSISRFFARRANMLGENEDETLKIDMLYEGARDLLSPYLNHYFTSMENFMETTKKANLKYLPIFNQVMVDNGSNGYLVGNKLTLADLALFEVLLCVEELCGMSELENYTNLKKFLETTKSIDSISNYLNGPQRHKKNDEEYVSTVKKLLKF